MSTVLGIEPQAVQFQVSYGSKADVPTFEPCPLFPRKRDIGRSTLWHKNKTTLK